MPLIIFRRYPPGSWRTCRLWAVAAEFSAPARGPLTTLPPPRRDRKLYVLLVPGCRRRAVELEAVVPIGAVRKMEMDCLDREIDVSFVLVGVGVGGVASDDGGGGGTDSCQWAFYGRSDGVDDGGGCWLVAVVVVVRGKW